MRLGKGKRRALAALGFLLAALLLIVLAVPLWLPWAFESAASRAGLRYSTYERKGYAHFILRGVTFTNADVRFHAAQAELLTPAIWAWHCLAGAGTNPPPFVRAEDWNLRILEQSPAQQAAPSASIYTNAADVTNAIIALKRWLPAAELSNGTLQFPTTEILLPHVKWSQGDLNASWEMPGQHQRGAIHADFQTFPCRAQIQSDSAQLQADLSLSFESAGLNLQAAGSWQTNRFQSEAHFSRTGTLPEAAQLRVQDFRIPGTLIRLPDYRDISGDLRAAWTNGEFALDLTAAGNPTTANTNLPPFHIDLKAGGNTNFAVIHTGIVSSPWLRAELSRETTVHFKGRLLQEPVTVKLSAHLDSQPWIKARGTFVGELDLKPGNEKYPAAAFHLAGTNIGNAAIEARRLSVEGQAQWPALAITSAEALIDDGSAIQAKGSFNVASRIVSLGSITFQGPAAARWLPAGYGYENAGVTLDFAGPLTNLTHSGHIVLTNLAIPQFEPLDARVDWHGTNTQLSQTEVQITHRETAFKAVFSGELTTTNPISPRTWDSLRVSVLLQSCALTVNPRVQQRRAGVPPLPGVRGNATSNHQRSAEENLTVFELHKPARFIFEPGAAANTWSAQIDHFEGAGTGGSLLLAADILWPQRGDFTLSAKDASSDVLNYFRTNSVEPVKIVRLDLKGGWTNGPIVFALDGVAEANVQSPGPKGQAAIQSTNAETISAEFKAWGGGNGLMITNLVIRSQTSSVAVAHGTLPLTILPAQTNLIQIETKKAANFVLKTEPRSVFWEKLSEWTGAALKEPYLNVDISGTWEAPRGRLTVSAQELQLPAKRSNLPRMERLELDVGLDRETAILTNLSLMVQGQPVTATGRMPLGESFWADLKEGRPPNWQTASGRLQVKEAQISAFSSLFPALLTPQGTFHLDLSLQPGGKLQGELALKQARTRPLPGVGPIRDIDLTLLLTGRTVKLAEATLTIGGSPVIAAGEADLSRSGWLTNIPPPFEFVLFGTNVPLSRQPDSILRSDLNLSVKKTNGAPPLISGSVRLRDSYYLSDLSDLVPGKIATPEHRPPYFSVSEPGLADWRLALRVAGERGLKVRSTLFNGQVSPNLRVQGTLKEPIALGDVKIENGTVKFPFATLDLQRGYVTLTSEDPYRPHLMVSAASKKFGYDVRMELTGPADQPVIQFNSTPPLSSEQLVLMLTAGELPKGGYTLTPSQRAQTMALFLGKDLLAKLGFGDQSEERLSFSSGQEISETGKPTYSLEYKLADRWSLVGEYDRFNAFNAGFKWKLYSK